MSVENILLSFRNGVRKILINRPQKKNAISQSMYKRLAEILNADAKDDKIVIAIITGAGDYFSSGNDIKDAIEAGASFHGARNLVQAFINYPKPIIAVVNGPAIGIAATAAALCDIVYASDRAYFDTPFIRLGLCAEGTSSYMFPRILGRSKASEALLLNEKISAAEAYHFGLVSKVIPHEKLDTFIDGLYKYGTLPVNTLKVNKRLIMHHLRNTLNEANQTEFESLEKCTYSEEFAQAVMQFMQKKSKL